MVELNMELEKSKRLNFPQLTRLELEALVYVIRKITRAWELGGRVNNER